MYFPGFGSCGSFRTARVAKNSVFFLKVTVDSSPLPGPRRLFLRGPEPCCAQYKWAVTPVLVPGVFALFAEKVQLIRDISPVSH
eukprot:256212-Rhodomonas_salina.1